MCDRIERAERLYLYRVLDADDDGDPLDIGVVRCDDEADVAEYLRLRLLEELQLEGPLEVKVYPLRDRPSGVLEDHGDPSILRIT